MSSIQELVLPVTSDSPQFERGSLFFVGTATVILRYAGFTILTDPNFLHAGDHIHVGYGLTAKRLTNPAIEIEALPAIDLVVLSHMHADHFDRIAAAKLDKSLPIVTTAHACQKLKNLGFSNTHALDTWQTLLIRKGEAALQLTAMPGIHGPGPLKFALPPVMGSMFEFQTAAGRTTFRLYITGDTLIHDDLKRIPQRFPKIDLALLHLGGTKAFGILLTMDGKQGVKIMQIVAPKTAIPIHFNDYTLFKSPLADFVQEVEAAGLQDQVRYLNHGDTYEFEVATIASSQEVDA
mgnify:CR=1 FL=1